MPTGMRSLCPDDKTCVEHRDEHAATADLSERKHEEFSRSSGTPAQRRASFAIGINHLLGNFCGNMRVAATRIHTPTMRVAKKVRCCGVIGIGEACQDRSLESPRMMRTESHHTIKGCLFREAVQRRYDSGIRLASNNVRQGGFKRPCTEVLRLVRDRGQRSGLPDCAKRRLSTCRCAEFAARRQHRETLRRLAEGRSRDFRR